MKASSEPGGKRPIDRVEEGLLPLVGFGGPAIAVVTGTGLFALGIDVVVSLGAIVLGAVAGYFAMFVIVLIGMSVSEGRQGNGRAVGASDNEGSSREYVVVWLAVLLPTLVAFGATLLSARLLTGIGREIIGMALAVLCLVVVLGALIRAVRQRAEESARRVKWLRDRGATAAGDPEFLEQLHQEGWREDGPYDEMRAAYFRAWETVKEGRRSEGRPIWPGGTDAPEPPNDP